MVTYTKKYACLAFWSFPQNLYLLEHLKMHVHKNMFISLIWLCNLAIFWQNSCQNFISPSSKKCLLNFLMHSLSQINLFLIWPCNPMALRKFTWFNIYAKIILLQTNFRFLFKICSFKRYLTEKLFILVHLLFVEFMPK